MSESTTTTGVTRAILPGENGFGGIQYTDEEIARMQAELGAAGTGEESESGADSTAPQPAEAAGASAEAPPAPSAARKKWEPKKDPYEVPPFMAQIAPLFYLWTYEAIQEGGYDYEVSEGKLERRYRPIDGLLLERVGRPGDGQQTMVAIWLYEETLASDRSGRVVKAGRGHRVHVALNQHMRELVPMLSESGAPHVIIRPLGFETLSDGSVEMKVQLWVEPDPADPAKIRLISLETVLGRAA